MKQVNIYALSDPTTNETRYIGATKNSMRRRLNGHLSDGNGEKKNSWIDSLRLNNLVPLIEIIDVVDYDDRNFWEQHYISLYRSWGFNLLNATDGGDKNFKK